MEQMLPLCTAMLPTPSGLAPNGIEKLYFSTLVFNQTWLAYKWIVVTSQAKTFSTTG